jgi:hypothetical protein
MVTSRSVWVGVISRTGLPELINMCSNPPNVRLGIHSYTFRMSLTLYALIAAVVAVGLFRLSRVGRRPKGYPPGPPTLPILGNLHLMPSEKPHLQFQKWAEEYGPVYSLMLGTKVMVVLNSDQAIKDLLDKRSGIYSSRIDMYLGMVISGGLRMLLMVCRSRVSMVGPY